MSEVTLQETVEEHLAHDELDKLKMVAALTASALTFTANRWPKFLKEVGFAQDELEAMPSVEWFKRELRDPAIQTAAMLNMLL